MNFGLEGASLLSPLSGRAPYSASFSRRFGILSSSPIHSPVKSLMQEDDTIKDEPTLVQIREQAQGRRVSEGDSQAVIQYEDCTGAAYRIRKGVSKTSLQVR